MAHGSVRMDEGCEQRASVGSAGNGQRKRAPQLTEEVLLDVNECHHPRCERFRAPAAKATRSLLSKTSSLISMMDSKVFIAETMHRGPVGKRCDQVK